MPKKNRISLVQKIQQERKSVLITYITSTRAGLEVPMAMDQIRVIYQHLAELLSSRKTKPAIDLFINTNGGDGTVPWRLCTLIREYASKFSVLVPYRCFSAGTLTALGADEIVMHQMGMLGPTDPNVTNPFNPTDPANPSRRLGISVEDVTAYLALVKEDAGIRHEDELIQGFTRLADKVHPLALGNVKRFLSQSRLMARKLLDLHMRTPDKDHKIKEIVDNLTSKLYFHGHPINRKEAKDTVGLDTLVDPSERLEKLMWDLYLEYEKEMQLDSPFSAASEFLDDFPNQTPGTPAVTGLKKAKLAYIECEKHSNLFLFQYMLSGTKQPDGSTQVTLITRKEGWEEE